MYLYCKQSLKRLSLLGVVAVLLSFISVAHVHAQGVVVSDPHEVVQNTTDNVIAFLGKGVDPSTQTDQFVTELFAILEPAVAFQYIAKGVMGVHGKNATPQQLDAFTAAFTRGLVTTYGKGVSGFQGVDVKVLPPQSPIGDQRRATVVQEISTSGGITKVAYSMAKNSQGQWKIINLVLSGINFGQTFRGQFAAAVSRNNGDVDRTIDEWGNGVSGG